MPTINKYTREVPKINRNGRINTTSNSAITSSTSSSGGGIDYVFNNGIDISANVVSFSGTYTGDTSIYGDLYVSGNIMASEDVIAFFVSEASTAIIDSLTASLPLLKTGNNLSLNYDPSQFELVSQNLTIKSSILGGGVDISPRLNITDASLLTLTNRYNKTEASLYTLTNRVNSIDTSIASFYTKTQIDASFAKYYTKTQIDASYGLKADVTYVQNNYSLKTHNHTGVYEAANTNIQSHISSTFNPHSTTASQVGLGNVTNESKATMFSNPTFTGTVSGITASSVGLGNVTNESKATMFSNPTFTGTVSGITASSVGLGNVTNESKTTMFTNPIFTGTVGKFNVDSSIIFVGTKGNIMMNSSTATLRLNGGYSQDTSFGGGIQLFGNYYDPSSFRGSVSLIGGKGDSSLNRGSVLISTVDVSGNSIERMKYFGGENKARINITNAFLNADGSIGAPAFTIKDASSNTIWTISLSGTDIIFKNSSNVNKMKLDQSGNLTCAGEITAFGTI